MRANLLILLFLSLVLVVPAMAFTDKTFNAPSGQAIFSIDLNAPIGTTGTITTTQEDGNVTTFSWSYVPYSIGAIATTGISGDTSTYSYLTGGNLKGEIWIRTDTTLSFSEWRFGTGQVYGFWNVLKEAWAGSSPIMSYHVVSDGDVTTTEKVISYTDAVSNLNNLASNNDWVNYILSLVGSFVDFITQLFYWIKYFFVDNLAMIVALFLAVPMAFAAKNSRGNPEKFLRQYFKTLKGFFGFIVWLWTALIRTAAYIRGMFKIV